MYPHNELFFLSSSCHSRLYSCQCAVIILVTRYEVVSVIEFNPLNAELNPICHLLALLGAHHILHVSRIRINPDVDVTLTSIVGCARVWIRLWTGSK